MSNASFLNHEMFQCCQVASQNALDQHSTLAVSLAGFDFELLAFSIHSEVPLGKYFWNFSCHTYLEPTCSI